MKDRFIIQEMGILFCKIEFNGLDLKFISYTQDNEKKRAALKTNSMVEESINSVSYQNKDLFAYEIGC